ncbi:MAG: ytkA-like family protein [Rhizobium sp.]|nr:ytkA-like family protein [Rhizobium sp.]
MNSILSTARLLLAATILFSTSGISSFAGADDYEFQPVTAELPAGPASEFAVKLIDKRTGKPVPDAIIFEARLDMAPDGMEMMTSNVEAVPTTEPGVYKFKLNLSMAGGWRFQLAAKIQGEQETAKGEVVLKATQ